MAEGPKEEIDPLRKGFGLRLQAARKGAKRRDGGTGYTQEEVAAMFDVNKATVSAWETGRGAPDAYVLRSLAKLYNVSSDALLWEDSLSPEAMEIAAEFDHLDDTTRRAWRLVWLGFVARAAEGGELLPPAPRDIPDAQDREKPAREVTTPRRPPTVESPTVTVRHGAKRKS